MKYFIVRCFLLLLACSKKGNGPQPSNQSCSISSQDYAFTDGTSATVESSKTQYEFDAQGRLVSRNELNHLNENWNHAYRYKPDGKVDTCISYVDNKLHSRTFATYDNVGRISRIIEVRYKTNSTDTIRENYSYDANKITSNNEGTGTTIVTYFENGNNVKEEHTNNLGTLFATVRREYSGVDNKHTNLETALFLTSRQHVSKKLVSKLTLNDRPSYVYTYEFSKSGYPVKITEAAAGSGVATYKATYTCK